MVFRFLLGIDIVAAAVVVYFFIVGLADRSISLYNADLWAGLLLSIAAIIAAGITLRRNERTVMAILVLGFLAAPTLLYGVFILTVILSGQRWN
jgi:hypothetical protein